MAEWMHGHIYTDDGLCGINVGLTPCTANFERGQLWSDRLSERQKTWSADDMTSNISEQQMAWAADRRCEIQNWAARTIWPISTKGRLISPEWARVMWRWLGPLNFWLSIFFYFTNFHSGWRLPPSTWPHQHTTICPLANTSTITRSFFLLSIFT